MQLTAERPPDATRRARPIYRVFVSSTWLDLQPERQALMNALHRMEEMRFVGMEFFGTRADDTHAASLDQVDACEVFVGIIGFRYGSGITAAEYRRAREHGLPCFLYFKDEVARVPELTDGEPARGAQLEAFKAELLRAHMVKTFVQPDELAAAATADLHNWIASRWVSAEPAAMGRARPTGDTAERANLGRLLERIEHDWIQGVLEASLHHRARLELGLDWKADAVEHPWERIVVAPNRPIGRLRTEDSIAGIFSAAQNTLLVLGEPGGGKTTSLLELALDLIGRARASATEPVPIVLALSTWTGAQRDFLAWIVAELALRYQVPKRLGRAWVEEGTLVLLLDGLDEVAAPIRADCVAAINAFQESHPPAGLAVTCRVAEYESLSRKLRLRAAICLQPLSLAQVEDYLAAAGPRLASLARALQDDERLRELARTPLMLTVMTMAWHDAENVASQPETATLESRRRQIFDAYVDAMVRRRGKAAPEYPPAETVRWLSWLARQMRQHGLTLFALEQLQPSWLGTRRRQLAYFLFTRLLWAIGTAVMWLGMFAASPDRVARTKAAPLSNPAIVAIVFAFAVVLGAGLGFFDARLAATPPRRHRNNWRLGGFLGLILFSLFGANWAIETFGGSPALAANLSLYVILFGLAFCRPLDAGEQDITPSDTVRWTWRAALDRFYAGGIGIALIITIGFLAATGLAVAQGRWSAVWAPIAADRPFLIGLAFGVVGALIVWTRAKSRSVSAAFGGYAVLVVAAVAGAIAGPNRAVALSLFLAGTLVSALVGIGGGFVSETMDPVRPRRSGWWFWLRVPLLAMLVSGFVTALPLVGVVYVIWERQRHPQDLVYVLDVARTVVCIAMVTFLRFGGVNGLQHYFLRWLLVRDGHLPRRAEGFLNHAAQLALIQRVGFGYRFVHALLVEHLATRAPAGDATASTLPGKTRG